MKTSEQNRSNKRIEKGRFDWFILERIQTDVTKTGNGERGTGNGERGVGNGERKSGNELSAETSTKSKMAVQKMRERKKKTKKGIRSCLG